MEQVQQLPTAPIRQGLEDPIHVVGHGVRYASNYLHVKPDEAEL
jgi:hypothetical protein